MKTAHNTLSAKLCRLILKLLDLLIFGGNTTITISAKEWRRMTQTSSRSVGRCDVSIPMNDYAMDEGSMFPKWFTTTLPTVYDDRNGESFFMSSRP